jgi:hypothetical protein
MAKRPPLPLVLTANDLLDGSTVYFDGLGWTDDLALAMVAGDDTSAAGLEARLEQAERSGETVEPYLATVVAGPEGVPLPVHYREKIRVVGPTFRDDFGRNQAPGAIDVQIR